MSDHEAPEEEDAEIVSHLPTAPPPASTPRGRSISPWVWVSVVIVFVVVAIGVTMFAILVSVVDQLDEALADDHSVVQTVPA